MFLIFSDVKDFKETNSGIYQKGDKLEEKLTAYFRNEELLELEPPPAKIQPLESSSIQAPKINQEMEEPEEIALEIVQSDVTEC